jgi:hypothetical protein
MKYHAKPEDRETVLISGWFHKLQIKKFRGQPPTCHRCGKELKVGDKIHSHRQGPYHLECWEALFIDI